MWGPVAKASRYPPVLTEALILGRAGREAVIALAGVAPPRVEAAPVLTDARLGLTLILIWAVSLKDRKQEESSDHFVQEWTLSFLKFSLWILGKLFTWVPNIKGIRTYSAKFPLFSLSPATNSPPGSQLCY